ncbi:hypothetical protein GQ53DRAFT_779848 [Thozetella sp. PMI_491]|nr:hypothetical protein GQ53DRAFT_779848 [Thozetella sp. PMI_491]
MKRSRESEGIPAASLPAAKVAELDADVGDAAGLTMRCSLPPHKEPLVFTTYKEYEAHYSNAHTNRCIECRKNFPSSHLLGVHIEEWHDSFVAVKREKGEQTYSCFVQGCERKCLTPQKRRLHLIDKHMYPKNFFFAVTRDGIDGRQSLLLKGRTHSGARRPLGTTPAKESDQIPVAKVKRPEDLGGEGAAEEQGQSLAIESHLQPDSGEPPDVDMEELSGVMSALQFVPSSVRFGRAGRRAGFARR